MSISKHNEWRVEVIKCAENQANFSGMDLDNFSAYVFENQYFIDELSPAIASHILLQKYIEQHKH